MSVNITCKLCNQSVLPKIISIHLRAHHGVNFNDYVRNNLDDFRQFGWTECEVCGTVTKAQGKKGRTCSRTCLAKLRKTWTGEKSPHFGFQMSDESKRKIGIANSHPRPENMGENNSSKRKEVREKMSKTRIEKGYSKGKNNPMFGKKHTVESRKKMFSIGHSMNKLEKRVADELDRLGLKYTYQFFISEGNEVGAYDFKIKNKPIIIEVDGDYWHGNPNTKSHFRGAEKTRIKDSLKEIMAKNRGYKIIRMWEADIKKDISVVKNRLREVIILESE